MLREFRALPSESRAQRMKDRDYLWCLANTLLDREERQARLCPECRSRAEQVRCPSCGRPASDWGEYSANAGFDLERFERMRGGESG